ncbi:DUF3841 domain-containing protein [Nocardia transvalensis]|nr:DUF3841 domain-containing protein [Nocardia transvalensis]
MIAYHRAMSSASPLPAGDPGRAIASPDGSVGVAIRSEYQQFTTAREELDHLCPGQARREVAEQVREGMARFVSWRRALPAGRIGCKVDAPELLLHSFQSAGAYRQLRADGVVRGPGEHMDPDLRPTWLPAYAWMTTQVEQRTGVRMPPGSIPIWVWAYTTRQALIGEARTYARNQPGPSCSPCASPPSKCCCPNSATGTRRSDNRCSIHPTGPGSSTNCSVLGSTCSPSGIRISGTASKPALPELRADHVVADMEPMP